MHKAKRDKTSVRSTKGTFGEQLRACHSLEDLLSLLKITEWDYVIVGDGSGSTWQRESGWASTLVENITFKRRSFCGALSNGTSNMAEMLAFLHPLLYLAGNAPQLTNGLQVHVITDSNLVARCGNGEQNRIANAELWFLFDAFRRKGIRTQFHWIPRDHVDLNRFADELAGRARLAIVDLEQGAVDAVAAEYSLDATSLYGINPAVE
jgi:ribonuclease HI